MPSEPPIDILVVGAGPVGLSFALGAIHRGARNVIVVEQARAFRASGNYFDILPNGYRALCAIAPDVRERMKPHMDRRGVTIEKPRIVTLDPHGKEVSRTIMKQEMASLRWWQLQRVLLEGLRGRRCVMLNHQLFDLAYNSEGMAEATLAVGKAAKIAKQWRKVDESVEEWDGSGEMGVVQKGLGEDYDEWYWKLFERVEVAAPEDGEEAVFVKCRASLVVAADGINSVARSCLYRDCGGWKDFAEASYSGISTVGLIGASNADKAVQDEIQELYERKATFQVLTAEEQKVTHETPRCIFGVLTKDQKPVWFMFIFLALNEHAVENFSDLELLEIVGEQLTKAGFPESLKKLMYSVYENRKSFTFRKHRVIPVTNPPPFKELSTAPHVPYPDDFQPPWYHRRVVLIGDAAHGMPPALGQGVCMGLEDSLELLTKLEDEGVLGEDVHKMPGESVLRRAFETFKASRMERVCTVQAHGINRMSEYQAEDKENLREWFFSYAPRGIDLNRFI